MSKTISFTNEEIRYLITFLGAKWDEQYDDSHEDFKIVSNLTNKFGIHYNRQINC